MQEPGHCVGPIELKQSSDVEVADPLTGREYAVGDERMELGGLRVAAELAALLADEIAPGTGVAPDAFWTALAQIVRDLAPKNAALLARRKALQDEIDGWLRARAGQAVDAAEQEAFLREIGYLLEETEPFEVSTAHVDPEIAELSGPQLVVPVDNARYALNAANARWGSLYDALYGTDVIAEEPGAERGEGYNPARGALVVQRAAEWLDEMAPLAAGSHAQVDAYVIDRSAASARLEIRLADGRRVGLADREQFAGYRLHGDQRSSILLVHRGIHAEILIDPNHPVGQSHAAGVCDVILESALTTIQDCEDSVAAVDAGDKVRVYRNWLGLMRGTLSAELVKNGERVTRRLNADRVYTRPDGSERMLPGRSLLLVRNVGLHMFTDAVLTAEGDAIPEAFLDAMFTCLAAKHDLLGEGAYRNSRAGSIYVVKPKQHGPAEVAATCELFARVEQALGLEPGTVKIGIMDEERRTTLNLGTCLHMARDRVIFINTGFLDRTGDEIHTMMAWGPVLPKEEIKSTPWMLAYEDHNVDVGLACGLAGQGQIGKGMWAMPDEMAAMLESKIAHPEAGASTAWVPSPTAATLHAMHYHRVDVRARQAVLRRRAPAPLASILTLPALDRDLSKDEIQRELENNAQGILGYVVRWVEQGIGCSKVPDISNRGLMEDRATLRISSQHIANWLRHELVTRSEVMQVFERMAEVVDAQNAGDPAYRNMAPDFDHSVAFQAALELVLLGEEQPNGYTESVLHKRRREFKRLVLEEDSAD